MANFMTLSSCLGWVYVLLSCNLVCSVLVGGAIQYDYGARFPRILLTGAHRVGGPSTMMMIMMTTGCKAANCMLGSGWDIYSTNSSTP
jgi:hypothetical protein